MRFLFKTEEFEDDVGKVWRGMVTAGQRSFNFVLPLKSGSSYIDAEAATVYELSKILPTLLDVNDKAEIILSSLLISDRVWKSSAIIDNLKKVDFSIDIDETWMKENASQSN